MTFKWPSKFPAAFVSSFWLQSSGTSHPPWCFVLSNTSRSISTLCNSGYFCELWRHIPRQILFILTPTTFTIWWRRWRRWWRGARRTSIWGWLLFLKNSMELLDKLQLENNLRKRLTSLLSRTAAKIIPRVGTKQFHQNWAIFPWNKNVLWSGITQFVMRISHANCTLQYGSLVCS